MLTYDMSKRGSTSLYLYLYDCIKEDIVSGTLKPGTRLPSKRALAQQNGVSVVTVEGAYSLLVEEGYVEAVEKSGHFVSSQLPALMRPLQPLNSGVAAGSSVGADAGSSAGAGAAKPQVRYDLTGSTPLEEHFPITVWSRLLRKQFANNAPEMLTQSPHAGSLRLRTAIASYLRSYRMVTVSPEQIIIGAGTEYFYPHILQLLDGATKVALEDPGWHKLALVCELFDRDVTYVPVDQDGLEVDVLEASEAQLAWTSPSQGFPLGTVMSVARRQEILDWAQAKEERYLIEDDYDSEFRMSGRPITPLFAADTAGKVIYTNTFSKTVSPSVRISYMVLPPALAQAYHERLGFYSCVVSRFTQEAMAAFIEDGSFEKQINRMRNFYRKQRQAMIEALKESALASRIRLSGVDTSLHLLVYLDTRLPDEVLIARAAHKGIALRMVSGNVDGERLQKSGRFEHLAIFNYSGIEQVDMVDAFNELATILDDM